MNAVLVLIAFAAFAVLMYVRALPALIAVPAMGLTMALAAGVHPAALGPIVTTGVIALAPVYAAVVFGALLGRVTLDTGIARAMVNVAAEYGGEKPLWMALGLCAVVALLFTSLNGLGAIIMVGSVALPIMMTTGVPRPIAATLFLMAFALGFIFNAANWTFYTTYFGIGEPQLFRYALVLGAIDAVALVAYAVISFARYRGYAQWAVRTKTDDRQGVPAIAMITPLLPLALYYGFHLDAVPAFLIAAIYGAVVARPKDAIKTLVAAGIRGVEDVAPALLLFMGIGILSTATKQPQFVAALQPLIGDWLRNPIAYVVVFGLASPLTLYRGPLNPFGVGIAARADRRRVGGGGNGGRAGAECLRPHQHRQRVGRELHRRADRNADETNASVPSRRGRRRDARGRVVLESAVWDASLRRGAAGRTRGRSRTAGPLRAAVSGWTHRRRGRRFVVRPRCDRRVGRSVQRHRHRDLGWSGAR
jgi:hypothetical protein